MIDNYLLIYDIKDKNTKYSKIYKMMNIISSKRIQKSVFLIQDEKKEVMKLVHKLKRLINPEEDKIMLIPLCHDDWNQVEMIGLEQKEGIEKKDYYIL